MKEQIVQILTDAVVKLQASGDLPTEITPNVLVERTRDRAHGDFASNLAMTLAKAARCKPRDLAEKIVALIETGGHIKKVEIAGPGFINFYLGTDAWHGVIGDILEQGNRYGLGSVGAGQELRWSPILAALSASPSRQTR